MYQFQISRFCHDNFPFAIHFNSNYNTYPIHAHDFTELVVVSGGKGVHMVDADRYPISAGDIFVITEGVAHGYFDTREFRLTNLLLDLKNLPLPISYLRELPGFHALFEIEPRLRKKHEFKSCLKLPDDQLAAVNLMLKQLSMEMKNRKTGYKAAVSGLLTELIVFLSRHYDNAHAVGNMLEISRLGQVISQIETGFAGEIALDDLAATAHMSKWAFLRYFNSVFNMTPIQYLLRVRLDKAAELLHYSNLPISDIALQTGFTDSNYFSRQFRKCKGSSPRQFRLHSR